MRALIAAGDTKKAVKLYRDETGAEMGEAAAALGRVAQELRGG